MAVEVAASHEQQTSYPGGAAHKSKNGGVAPIRAQYVIRHTAPSRSQAPDHDNDDAAEQASNPASFLPSAVNGRAGQAAVAAADGVKADENGAPRKERLSGAQRKRLKKQEAAEARKKSRGMNVKRRFEHVRDENMVCNHIARGRPCPREPCKFSHSIATYLKTKPKDLRFPFPPTTSQQGCLLELSERDRAAYLDKYYTTSEPFSLFGNEDSDGIIDTETYCPVAAAQQHASSSSTQVVKGAACYAGWACRFLGGHARAVGQGKGVDGAGWELVGQTESAENGKVEDDAARRNAPDELNWLQPWMPKALKTRSYDLYRTKAALARLQHEADDETLQRRGPICIDEAKAKALYGNDAQSSSAPSADGLDLTNGDIDAQEDDIDMLMNSTSSKEMPSTQQSARLADSADSNREDDVARIRPGEKRRLNWSHDELYLAPLTTTGNLPFRRLCVSMGADITCGEMGLAESFLQGSKNEWSLVRRWEGERCFGTQLCGSKPDLLVPTAEALSREFASGLDFIDVNCGCPIDMVFNHGGGSALLDHQAKLGRIVRGMSAVTGDIPITVKLRTGTSSTQTTHRLFPKLKVDFDVGAATLHGRSRQQRYKNLADWDYIKRCTTALRESIAKNNEERPDEDWVHPIPIYGNGDVYSWQDYEANKALTGVDGQMLARGALIKPWLFTEIKERRDWDISSRERLDMIRQLSSYGVTHWGSDSLGVNQTRRFVCEALSFMHRYIPVGILESLPVSMNDRPAPFQGRDDLETLLASPNSQDWVRISEMFLGKAPPEWSFTPKHKSNTYDDGAVESQG